MQTNINERIIDEANYIINTNSTIRQTAQYFGISKSTAHIDVTKRLREIDFCLSREVEEVLKYNLSVRHIRGGQSTKNKYCCEEVKYNQIVDISNV